MVLSSIFWIAAFVVVLMTYDYFVRQVESSKETKEVKVLDYSYYFGPVWKEIWAYIVILKTKDEEYRFYLSKEVEKTCLLDNLRDKNLRLDYFELPEGIKVVTKISINQQGGAQ